MLISIIIPSWNGKDFLTHCLPSIKGQTQKDFEIIIVDNGSTDGSVEYIKQNFPDFKVIKLKHNLGFAPAINEGIKQAKGKYIALINNDTEIDKKCLEYLSKVLNSRPEISFVAAKMLNFFQRDIIDSAGDYIEVTGHGNNIGQGEKDGPLYSKSGPTFLVTGGGSLIRRSVIDKVGLLDETYFAYYEDVDWCLRAQLQGFKGWYEPKAVIYHIHKATSSRAKSFTEYLQFRNMTMTIIKDYPTGLLLHNFNWLKIVLVNINTVRFLSTHGYFKQAIQAEIYIIRNLLRLLKERSTIQSQKKVDDTYIIENFREKRITFFGLFK